MCFMLSIAMCTYNGERYLPEQLESIWEQTVPVDELVVVDDGSTDSTMEILQAEVLAHPCMRVVQNSTSRGACRNFEYAISLCTGDYIACADQDDVWLPDKLERLLQALQNVERERGTAEPILVHSDLRVVDSALHTISDSFMASQHLLPIPTECEWQILAVSNYVTGCAMMFNRALRDRALPFGEHAIMHDYYLALLASLAGTIRYVDSATILYRQHGHNTIGAQKNSPIGYLNKLVSPKAITNTHEKLAQLRELLENKHLIAKRATAMQDFIRQLDSHEYLSWLAHNLDWRHLWTCRNQNIKCIFFAWRTFVFAYSNSVRR